MLHLVDYWVQLRRCIMEIKINKDKRNKILIITGAIALLALAIVFLRPETSSRVYGPAENMDKEFILGFDWSVGRSEFKFSRDNVNSSWLPAVDPESIRKRVSALPMTGFEKVSLPKGKRVTVQVLFDGKNGNKPELWVGAWSSGIFLWKEGPYKGLGKKLDEEQNRLFEEGQYAFTDHRIDWCRSRIKNLSHEKDSFEFSKGEWVYSSENITGTKGRGPFFENWMGTNCRIQVDHFVDPDLKSPNMLLAPKISVTFEKASSVNIAQHESGIFKFDDVYFRSSSFENAIKELGKL
jgi:hypothetical protein